MTHEPESHDAVSGTDTHSAIESPKPQYQRPQVRLINEEEALSAFQVVLSAGSAGWWIA